MSQAGPNLQRHDVVDALRGFAIFGILVVNLPLFGSPIYLMILGESWFPGAADRFAAAGIIALFQGKFINLFAMLFGFGMALQGERMDARGIPLWPIYLRRQAVLWLFGLVHGLLFWFGDILFWYAMVGSVLVFVRRVWMWLLIVGAICFAALLPALTGLMWLSAAFFPEMVAPEIHKSALEFSKALEPAQATYRNGSYAEIVAYNFGQWSTAATSMMGYIWPVIAAFLIGLAAGRAGVLQRSHEWAPRLARWLPVTVALGLLGSAILLTQYRSGDMMMPRGLLFYGSLASAYLVPIMTIAYVTIFLMIWHDGGQRVLRHLAPVGRMALTNYLSHTLICTTLFNSYGGGLYGRIGPAACFGIALLIYGLQIPFSRFWLDRFRFGPIEWLWRSLTYLELQPFRKAAAGR